jgi:hypothetical protein
MESCGARFGGEKAPGLVPANSPSPPRLCAVQVGASIALDRLTLARSLTHSFTDTSIARAIYPTCRCHCPLHVDQIT